MHHFFVEPEQIREDCIEITGQDVNHIRQVLRMRPGEEIYIRSGEDAKEYRCRIERIDEDQVTARILWAEEDNTELPSRITLYQCLPKSDKMEWIIQKAVELGAYRIVPVSSRRSIVKLTGGKAEAKVKRWNAVSESAAKQSRRAIIPEVAQVHTFGQAIEDAGGQDIFLIPYELASDMEQTRQILAGIRPGQSVGIMIGPEGGLEKEEVDQAKSAGAREITLGRRILRTETAGMALITALMIQLEGKTEEEQVN